MTTAGPVRLLVRNPSGLHARPAALFVRTAAGYASAIRVSNLTRGTGPADAKSILTLLTLGVSRDHEIELTAEGDDADAAIAGLRQLIESGVGEEVEGVPGGPG
ncbi:MAG TPA: HPr family phosphocarrier protein [Candidatus Limnocylindrales bacterium]|nr:HPr family phosphocarrier protein [Candidatus Limnocylindrales bacterium]